MPPSEFSFKSQPLRQQIFTTPLISTLYERVLPPIWELGLRLGEPDTEYTSAAPHLGTGQLALDLSCGTGFVGQLLAASGNFDHVIGLDCSLQMLNECVASVERCDESSSKIMSWIRGDVMYLPFHDEVVDAIHWGAAMHFVPDVETAIPEVYRVVKPGGKLYGTTFLRPFPDIIFRFFTVEELDQLARQVGFGSNESMLQVEDNGLYGIIRAKKPESSKTSEGKL